MTQPAPLALDYSEAAATGGRAPWLRFLIVNASVPLAILAVYLVGLYVESSYFDAYYRRILMLIGFNVILAVGLQMINGFSGQFSLGHAGFMAVGAYLAAYPAKNYSNRLADPAATLVFYAALLICVAVVGSVLYALFAAIRTTRRIHASVPAVLVLAVLAWIVLDFTLSQRGSGSPLLVWSWGLELIQRMFAGISGALLAPAASVSSVLPVALRAPLTFIVLLLGAGTFAGIVGLVVGLPTLRLRGDYLAIATLGLSEIIRIIIQNSPPLGGALGLTNIPRYTSFAWLWGVAILSIVIVWRLAYSARGRQIIATREDEIAASAVGIGTTRQKVLAFVVGAFLGGVAGAMFAMQERSITPGYFNIQKSIEIVVIVTLGGLGSISGAILAAIVLTLLPELLRPIADYRMIIYSLLLVTMMLVRPQGLLGGRELWPRRKPAPLRGRDRPPTDPPPTLDRPHTQAAGDTKEREGLS
jgi:ABC-type branched-subunit amino acid transport system permease subunit